MSVYRQALKDKRIAAQILIPLIEFEFGFNGNDSPELIQAPTNKEQFEIIFEICKKHGWVKGPSYKRKGQNLYFRMSKNGFKEVYEIAGPFSNKYKNEWTSLLLERHGIIGGYQANKKKTHERISEILQKSEWKTLQELCLDLRLTPGTIREGLKDLRESGMLDSKKIGKSAYYKIRK